MSFRAVFAAVFLGTALVVAAFLLHRARPAGEVEQPSPDLVKASGKCAQCHRRETAAIVLEYERSSHAKHEITCLDCHRAFEGQESVEHRGFQMSAQVTPKSCATCHAEQYQQYLRSRHAAPAWAAVRGRTPFTAEQIRFAEQFHPGAVDRDANELARLEGEAATMAGCAACHSVGRPNADGSIGDCTDCHSRHWAAIELARAPETCGQCHLGPDHAQIEIYQASKHGAIYQAQREHMDFGVPPGDVTVAAMPVPTCSTCHMGGLGDLGSTHDTSRRLSYYLFAPISEKRPGYAENKARMQDLCNQCHSSEHTEEFYALAEAVLEATNEKVAAAKAIVDDAREEGLLSPEPFDEVMEFTWFDLWHYYGRTAKHGAYMGGADYVQWHGNYELLHKRVELEEELTARRNRRSNGVAR